MKSVLLLVSTIIATSTWEKHPSTKQVMSSALKHIKIEPYLASERAHANHGWLTSYRSFNFPNYYAPDFEHFGPIRILNEDIVSPKSGFPSHTHRDAEIFSYILSGELTHRDSTLAGSRESADKNLFYRMKRGDVQFTSAGTGVAHSEKNEHETDTVHFLQIWVLPWARGLTPVYHTDTFPEEDERKGFVTIISPLKGGVNATMEQEIAAEAVVEGTIPIHTDFLFGAGIVPRGKAFSWKVGGEDDVVTSKLDRKMCVYLPMTKGGVQRSD